MLESHIISVACARVRVWTAFFFFFFFFRRLFLLPTKNTASEKATT